MKVNRPITQEEVKKLKKGEYAHRNPNRRQRRHALRHPAPVEPVVPGGEQSVPGGYDLGKGGNVVGRASAPMGQQTLLEMPPLHVQRSRFRLILWIFVRRLRATWLALFRRLSSGSELPDR